MKIVQTSIRNDKSKNDYVKIEKDIVCEMDDNITTILLWIEKLNESDNSPVTEDVYTAIDCLNSSLESFKKL